MRASFSYSQRLHNKTDFDLAFKKKPITNDWLAIYGNVSNNKMDRLGVVVSKKVVKKATERNRIKRITREAFRLGEFGNSSLDIVIRIRKRVFPIQEKQFVFALKQLLTELRT